MAKQSNLFCYSKFISNKLEKKHSLGKLIKSGPFEKEIMHKEIRQVIKTFNSFGQTHTDMTEIKK
jgi:hypothetical protein